MARSATEALFEREKEMDRHCALVQVMVAAFKIRYHSNCSTCTDMNVKHLHAHVSD